MTQTFRRLPSSLIIHPENQPETAEAIYHLLACIDGGLSITTGQEAPQTITPSIGDTMGNGQWLYCRTSGSSNNPKIIRRRPASWIDSFEINRVQYGLTESDRVGVLGALDHSLSLYATMEALHVGADVYLLAGLSPRRQFRSLLESGITLLYATPTQLRLLVEASSLFQEKLPDLKLVLTGGGKLDSLCCTDLQTLCPHAKILEFYGATETSFITISDEDTPDGSVGKPFPDVKLKICDPNGLETKGVGEIWVESPYLFHSYAAGYSKDTRWQDGFLSIGEMGFIDANGNLFLKGRTSRMVTVSDQNVFLEDVETILQCDPRHIPLCRHCTP